jgi:ligand-binding sensor domain-containing protein
MASGPNLGGSAQFAVMQLHSRSALLLCFFGLLLYCGQWAQALDPSTRIRQYGHTSWRLGQSGLDYPSLAITQTRDGYLWLGTSHGLFRFDGIRFQHWTPPVGQPLPAEAIAFLKGASDGSLYIGTERGLARITNGQLYDYHVKMRWPGPFLEDSQGSMWMGDSGGGTPANTLCKIGKDNLSCLGAKDGFGCDEGIALTSDKPGSIWIGGWQGICRWQQNAKPLSYMLPRLSEPNQYNTGVWALASDGQGTLWAGVRGTGPGLGLLTLSANKWQTYSSEN